MFRRLEISTKTRQPLLRLEHPFGQIPNALYHVPADPPTNKSTDWIAFSSSSSRSKACSPGFLRTHDGVCLVLARYQTHCHPQASPWTDTRQNQS
ncbi:uncharacterized protein MELLADRAFT_88722 [Melampsora larici-populina 98AG31]|uniref:Uncharacterized protein n=1 Tax=Melampsora larici-populina (strain 98AG31 / pathotype 3-4-7) TaxID=747676 RepID=F4SE78_MELLP|nr:uncharacterized protein MELLADRAFT_88722 [Melampsora larici-populina 98AG31]EGF97048.1 hypothetical protein MELLADRAFT_88722 [Melampsora larici-populina 98AG31]